MVLFLGSQPLLWGLELLLIECRDSILWSCVWIRPVVGECLRGSFRAAAEEPMGPWSPQQQQLMERSWLGEVTVPKRDTVGSADPAQHGRSCRFRCQRR